MIIETIRLKNTSICHLEAKQILYKRGINCFLFVWQRQRNITFESIILYVNCQVLPYFDKCFFFFFFLWDLVILGSLYHTSWDFHFNCACLSVLLPQFVFSFNNNNPKIIIFSAKFYVE